MLAACYRKPQAEPMGQDMVAGNDSTVVKNARHPYTKAYFAMRSSN